MCRVRLRVRIYSLGFKVGACFLANSCLGFRVCRLGLGLWGFGFRDTGIGCGLLASLGSHVLALLVGNFMTSQCSLC